MISMCDLNLKGIITPIRSIYDFPLREIQDCDQNKIPAMFCETGDSNWGGFNVLRRKLPLVYEEDSA